MPNGVDLFKTRQELGEIQSAILRMDKEIREIQKKYGKRNNEGPLDILYTAVYHRMTQVSLTLSDVYDSLKNAEQLLESFKWATREDHEPPYDYTYSREKKPKS